MPSDTRERSRSNLRILTSTSSPTLTTSDGCLTRFHAMSVMCSKTVDAAEINEGTVVGEVLDDALDGIAFLQLLEKLLALCRVFLLNNRATRNHDVVAALVELDDLEFEALAFEVGRIATGTNIDQRSRQECTDIVDFDGEAALDAAIDDAFDDFTVLECFLELESRYVHESLSRATAWSRRNRLRRHRVQLRLHRQRRLRLRLSRHHGTVRWE